MFQKTARLVLEADSRQIKTAQRDLAEFDSRAKRVEKTAGTLGRTIGRLAGAFATGLFVRSVINNTIEQERVVAQLEATLKSTGNQVGITSGQLQAMAGELQKVTTFGDESVISAQGLLLTFTQIGKDVFPAALESVLNVSTAMGQDLKSSAIQVGKALNDPIQGITALQRSGIQFTESQKDLIKELVETGRQAEAQRVILAELETQFGGSARAARDTLGGAVKSLQNAFGDLLEGDSSGGGVRSTTDAINTLTDTLNSPEVKNGFAVMVGGILSVIKVAAEAIPKIIGFAQTVGEAIGRSVAGPDSPLGIVNQQIDQVSSRIAQLQDELARPRLLRLNPFASEQGMRDELEASVRQLEELRKEQEFWTNQTQQQAIPAVQSLGVNSTITFKGLAESGKTANDVIRTVTGSLREADTAADEAARQQEEWARRGQAVYSETRTAAELLNIRLAELNTLLEVGVIGWDTYSRAVFAAQDAFDSVQTKADETGKELDTFGKTAAENIQGAFANFLFDPFQDGLKGMLRGFVDTVRRMVSEAIAAQLARKLFGDLAGGTGSGFFGQALSSFGSFFGLKAVGGTVPAGGWAIAGERGPEIVRGPASITSTQQTAQQSGGANVRIINAWDVSAVKDYLGSNEGEEIIINAIQRNQRSVRGIVGGG